MPRSTRAARKPDRPYHHGNLRRALLDEALATIRAEGVDGLTLREIGARLGVSRTALYRHFADKRALLAAVATEGFRTLRQQLVTAWEEGGRGPRGVRVDGGGLRSLRRRQPGALSRDVRRLRRLRRRASPSWPPKRRAPSRRSWTPSPRCSVTRIMRGDDTVKMARFVWAVVHGVAMLGIDGQLREPGGVEELMRYALERLRTGIEAAERPGGDVVDIDTSHRPSRG